VAEAEAPTAALYAPAAQKAHEVPPVAAWKLPAEQLAHEAALLAEYAPAAHGTQLAAPVPPW
jgi:hypothetical protein